MSVRKCARTQKNLREFCGTWNYINPKVSAPPLQEEEEEDDVSNVKSTDRRHITYYGIYVVLVI